MEKAEEKKQYFINETFDRIIEVERITKEGATLKNVSDNIRSLTSFVAIFAVIILMIQEQMWQIQMMAILWGVWAFIYSVATGLQAGLLFLDFFAIKLLAKYLSKSNQNFKNLVAFLFAIVTLIFMFGSSVIIVKSIDIILKK